MSLRFILGPAGAGKTHRCLDEICSELVREPLLGPPLYFLVPEQATFQMERALLTHRAEVSASARARVVSFKRLAYLALQEVGAGGRPHLSEVGKLLALQAVLSKKRKELRLFGSIAGSEGFLEQLAATISELRTYRQTPSGLAAVCQLLEDEGLIAYKLHDIAVVYEAYDSFVQERFHDPQTALDLASAAIFHVDLFRGADVWIDGFAGFTPQEYAILESLLCVARRVSVALCLDPAALAGDDVDAWTEGPPEELFHPTRESLVQLRELARRSDVPIEPPLILASDRGPRFAGSPLLAWLERWMASGQRRLSLDDTPGREKGGDPVAEGDEAAIEVIEAPDPQAEVEAAAREIARMVREEGMRYSEIAVIARDLEPYRDLVESTFARWSIPYFLDHKEPAHHHPLVTLLRAALEIVSQGFETERVIRYLKTDLVPLSRVEVDTLENEALRLGIQGDVWRDESFWRRGPGKVMYGREEASWEEIRQIYERGVEPLAAFFDAARRAVQSREEGAAEGRKAIDRYLELLWNLLEANQAVSAIETWIDDALQRDERLVAEEHFQVYQGVVGLIEQLSHVLGDVEATPSEFAEIVTAGLKRLRIGRVPPRIDQVVVGSIERSRQPDLALAIILGANEGRFPKIPSEDVLFLDEERRLLESVGLRLGPDSGTKLLHEEYLVYIALTRASRRLVVTYSRADENGRPLRPSSFVTRLVASLPGVTWTALPAAGLPAVWPEHAGGLVPWLTRHLARVKDGEPASYVGRRQLLTAYDWLLDHPHAGLAPAERLERGPAADPLEALGHSNRNVPLTRDLVDALYGDPLVLSPSALETFASCAFSFFAGYGLGLEERVPFRLDAALLGLVSHAVLSRFVEVLTHEGIDWGDLEREQTDAMVERIVAESLEKVVGDQLKLRRSEHFALERLKKGLQAVVWALGEHVRKGSSRPSNVELSFAPQGALPPLEVETADGRRTIVRGRIDRIDEAEAEGVRYVRVIDYKSSARPFRLHRLIHGLDLQLAVYLAVLAQGKTGGGGFRVAPAGCLYQPVFDPLVSMEAPPEAGEGAWRKKLRADGLVLDDGVAPRLMDGEALGSSELVPLYFRKDGTLGSNSSAVDPEQMQALLEYTIRRVAELSEEIARGETGVAPYELSDKTPCGYCSFKAVCQFEPALGTTYRRLAPLGDEKAWEIIRSGGERSREESAG